MSTRNTKIYKRNCNYCGKYYESFGQFYCSRTCGGLGRRTKVQITCEECGKVFEISHCRAKVARFCSIHCSNVWQYKHNSNVGFQKGHPDIVPSEARKRAAKNISIALTGRKLTDEHKKNVGIASKGRKMPPRSKESKERARVTQTGKKYSEKSKKKMRESRLGIKLSEKTKRKMREAKINNPNRVFKNTGIELKMEVELKRRNLNYKKQESLCNIAIVDFLLPEYKIVIQCDGCFYHNCPIHCPNNYIGRREKDANQDKVLKENSYTVYRFWEHDINESVEKCVNQIKF